jgi:hypothetical protein
VNRPDEATESIGISTMGMMEYLNSQKNQRLRLLEKILWSVQLISASFVVVYLVAQHRILLRINFLTSEWILSVATSLNLIWSMHTTGLACKWEACHNVPKFNKVTEFLAHATQVHKYDVKIKLCHLPQSPLVACSAISSIDSSEVSSECESRPRAETPASTVSFEITNIDPRLLEPQTVNKELPSNRPVTDTLMSSVGSGMTNSGP